MSEKNDARKGFSRRTIVKGAAWSVPVVATAVAAPAAAASIVPFDVRVSSSCSGNYDLNGLLGLIAAIPGIGSGVGRLVQTALAAVGLTPVVSRSYTVTAAEGTIPAGTQFALTQSGALIDLSGLGLGSVVGASVLSLVSTSNNNAVLSLQSDLSEGQSTTITVPAGAIDVGLTSSTSLALVGSDQPSTLPGAPNSASLNLISVDTDLGKLIDVDALGLGFLLTPLVEAVKITVQLCPGQSLPGV